MPRSISDRLNAMLEGWLPEKRLFLRSDDQTRFIRLRPTTQALALGGTAIIFGWSVVATSILLTDTIAAGSSRDQAARSQAALEERLDALQSERDSRAAEAAAAQERFNVALNQVSDMQSQLLSSEERRRELETGMGVVQDTLREALKSRDKAEVDLAHLTGTDAPDMLTDKGRSEEFSVALDILSEELKTAAKERAEAEKAAAAARQAAATAKVERDQVIERQDQILTQLEDAVTMSTGPMDKVFRNVGMDPEKVLKTIRSGYSGTGGPLTPLSYSTSGNAAITEGETRANEIIVSLDKINSYRIAASKLPLSMPVKTAFRYTSPYGSRWGRMHKGVDMAGPSGSPIYSTADGVVYFAGWQSGFGQVVKIRHELGTETVYAHMSKIRAKVGQKVSRGDQVGDMGSTGRSTGSHLHYEVRVNGQAVNPMSFIKAAQN
ncbi:DUF5930 domain-containing protein [Paracoccus pacificus]|uniref:DUF5930 domain-containing protein n=1 Tax=Paracoccus pacificus TaxID=1463598 RepID=A0ABW4RB55_9RHOB